MKKLKQALIKWLFKDLVIAQGVSFSNIHIQDSSNNSFVVKADILILNGVELGNTEVQFTIKS